MDLKDERQIKVTLCGKRRFEELMFFIREQSSPKTSLIDFKVIASRDYEC